MIRSWRGEDRESERESESLRQGVWGGRERWGLWERVVTRILDLYIALYKVQRYSTRGGGAPRMRLGWRAALLHCAHCSNKQDCRYGEAPAPAASWRAHDGSRQRGTACPLLYRYRLTHTYCSLARLPPTHPFVGAPILQHTFSGPMARPPPSPPRPLPSHMHAGWMVSATKTPTSSAPSQDPPF